jgi:hypothetical protein
MREKLLCGEAALRRWRRIPRWLILALALCAGIAACQTKPAATGAVGSDSQTAPTAENSQKIYLDEHGNPTTPPKGANAAPAKPSATAPGEKSQPRTFTTKGGGQGVMLDESSMPQTVGTVGPDGKVRMESSPVPKAPDAKAKSESVVPNAVQEGASGGSTGGGE